MKVLVTGAKDNPTIVAHHLSFVLGASGVLGSAIYDAFKDIPLGRAGTATEAASAVLAVVSPLFSYVSGQTLMVTGGRNM